MSLESFERTGGRGNVARPMNSLRSCRRGSVQCRAVQDAHEILQILSQDGQLASELQSCNLKCVDFVAFRGEGGRKSQSIVL